MDICIGGIFDGQKIENNNDFFKVEEHYSDHSSKYIKQHFHLFGQIFTFWVCEDVDLTQAMSKAERILKNKKETN
ncbi:hypothetical protein [Acinetobacter calcoaceticus]|uniref:hypothetical protein n=1 Tax=Acinetobacter calcoaceticus TaxID=471 RepID=UPI0002D0677F|nr:hypothetical protein [Acinetobacter calcoaceticus]ENU08591.1 hypothetical protein F997_02038 [Acinetobacter calcoaceticus NIPH 13]